MYFVYCYNISFKIKNNNIYLMYHRRCYINILLLLYVEYIKKKQQINE